MLVNCNGKPEADAYGTFPPIVPSDFLERFCAHVEGVPYIPESQQTVWAVESEDFEELNKQIRDRIKQMRIDLLFDEPSTFEDENEDDKFLGENIWVERSISL